MDYAADDIETNWADSPFSSNEPTVSNCMYLLVYCQVSIYLHLVELKEEILMCEHLERTGAVTDDQEDMLVFYQQNARVESYCLAVHRRHTFFKCSVKLGFTTLVNTGAPQIILCFSLTCTGELKHSQNA